jgi:hypothetical protein
MAELETLHLPAAPTDALRAAGFTTAEEVRAASDETLDAVAGIGPATIQQIRAGGALPAPAEGAQPTDAGTVDGVRYPEPARPGALSQSAELLRDARALELALQQERATAGALLPAQRLDEAGPGHHYVVNGQAVNANGQPIQPRGDYLAPAP